MKKHVLVGCIEELDTTIRTKFIFLDKEKGEAKDVSLPLFYAIDRYNNRPNDGSYYTRIPFQFNRGLVEYSFGCGLSHYLQENLFEDIEASLNGFDMTFPLSDCRLSMLTPSDLTGILEVKGVHDDGLLDAIKNFY
ncbi:hypothetical protein [Rossellomorea marisflavi]|uniref:hypothetical protein n=1 Tax=Rossellomorea marisflavi TaxID=189381 RepID=UPI003F9F334D